MDENQISKVEEGLNKLIFKYKNNLSKDSRDPYRLKCTMEAKNAIRRIMLMMAITGDLQDISPVHDPDKGIGFEIVDANSKKYTIF